MDFIFTKFGFIHSQINLGDPNQFYLSFLLTQLFYLQHKTSCLQGHWWTSFNAIIWWLGSLHWEWIKLELKMKLILISYKLSLTRHVISCTPFFIQACAKALHTSNGQAYLWRKTLKVSCNMIFRLFREFFQACVLLWMILTVFYKIMMPFQLIFRHVKLRFLGNTSFP